jgi:hypothetical protein
LLEDFHGGRSNIRHHKRADSKQVVISVTSPWFEQSRTF